MRRFMEEVNVRRQNLFSFPFFYLDNVLKNSTPGEIAGLHLTIWAGPNRRDKFERTQIHFSPHVFNAVMVVVA